MQTANDDMDYMPITLRGIQNSDGSWDYGTIQQRQVRKLDTPFLAASLRLYSDFAVFKTLPHGKGTMDERESVLTILRTLQDEANSFDAWESERKRK